jgi:hypothetical protein
MAVMSMAVGRSDGVAVGLGFRKGGPADIAAGAFLLLDDDAVLPAFLLLDLLASTRI